MNTHVTGFRGLCLSTEDMGIVVPLLPLPTRPQYPLPFANRTPKTPPGAFAFMNLFKKEVGVSNTQSCEHECARNARKAANTSIAKPFDPVTRPRNMRGNPTGKEVT